MKRWKDENEIVPYESWKRPVLFFVHFKIRTSRPRYEECRTSKKHVSFYLFLTPIKRLINKYHIQMSEVGRYISNKFVWFGWFNNVHISVGEVIKSICFHTPKRAGKQRVKENVSSSVLFWNAHDSYGQDNSHHGKYEHHLVSNEPIIVLSDLDGCQRFEDEIWRFYDKRTKQDWFSHNPEGFRFFDYIVRGDAHNAKGFVELWFVFFVVL